MGRQLLLKWLKNPFVLLIAIVVFAFTGQTIIKKINRLEENHLRSQVRKTIENYYAGLHNPTDSLNYRDLLHARSVALPPAASIGKINNVTSPANSLKPGQSVIEIFGKGKFAIAVFEHTDHLADRDLPDTPASYDFFALIKERGHWLIVAYSPPAFSPGGDTIR